jgi:hypothetical protein
MHTNFLHMVVCRYIYTGNVFFLALIFARRVTLPSRVKKSKLLEGEN